MKFETDPMPVADTAQEFVLTLRHAPDGGPCGTLRAVGHHVEKTFEGWIDLIGLITEYRRTAVDHATTMRSTYERISGETSTASLRWSLTTLWSTMRRRAFPATKDGMLDYFRMVLAAFPYMRLDVEDLIAAEDKSGRSGDRHCDAPG